MKTLNEDKAALTLSGIKFSYAGVDEGCAAPPLNLQASFHTGEVVGIVGPNGSGKSTALKVASGILKPYEGRVLLGGKDLAMLSSKERARLLSYMPQSPVAPTATVENFVLCGRYAHTTLFHRANARDYEVVKKSISLAGITDLKNKSLSALSGGQRQRAHIALMLAQEASVMLFDEPLSALDISACHEMLELIYALAHTQEKAVVIVIHDLDLALRYCDKILVLDKGEVCFEGSPKEVIASEILREVFAIKTHPVVSQRKVGYAFFPVN